MRVTSRKLSLLFLVCFSFLFVSTSAQDLVWSVNYGGLYNEEGMAGLPTLDGHMAVLGSTFSQGSGEFDLFLVKLNHAGDTVWSRTYGGADTDYGYDIRETADGGFILVGQTRSFGRGAADVYLVRTDSTGDTLWSQTYGGSGDEEGRSVRVTSDDGFIICGTTDSYGAGYTDVYFVRTDSLGDTVWTKTVGGAGGESGFAVRQTSDGGFIAVGSTGSFGDGYSSIYAIRLDADGDSLWATTYGGSRADFGRTVEIALDGGLLFAGKTASFGAGFSDAYLVRTDADGNFQWQQTYGDTKEDAAYSIYRTMDGGYLISGTKEVSEARKLDVYLIKTDPAGNPVWERTYGGTKSDYGMMVFQETGHDYMLVGHTYSYTAGGSDLYIMKVEGEVTDAPDDEPVPEPSGFELAQNYPNPFNMSTIIEFVLPRRSQVTVTVYNILGQEVRQWQYEAVAAGRHSITWDGHNRSGWEIASGVYFYRMSAGKFIETRKMVLVK